MGNFYMESTQINYRRDEKLKTVDQKLQELSETSAIDTDIAPVFKSTNTYQPGDMVYYRNKLYVFNVEHTGTWAAADVTATDVTTEISSLKSGLTNLADVPIYTTDSALISAFRGKHDYYRTFVMSDSTKTMALLNEINEVSVYVVFFENQQMWGNHPNFYAFIQDSVWVGVLNIGENSVTVSACSKLAKNSELASYTEVYKVTADGVKTVAELLTDFYNRVPVVKKYVIIINNKILSLVQRSGSHVVFSNTAFVTSTFNTISIDLQKSGSVVSAKYMECSIDTSGNITVTDSSSYVPDNGVEIILAY